MKRWLITFSGSAYDSITAKTMEAAPRFGADQVLIFDDKWLMEQEFWYLNSWLWERLDDHGHPGRGFLWFAWKPFIIMETMKRMADGDIVMYVDADTYPIADFRVLYDQCARDGGIMGFMATGRETALLNSDWNKRDCMIVMGQDEHHYRQAPAAVARFMVFQKGSWRVQQFLCEWLAYCINPTAQTFDPSRYGTEHDGYRQHRVEQAIYTNLLHKYGQKLYREACEFGKDCPQDWDLYPQLFSQEFCPDPKTLDGSRFRNV